MIANLEELSVKTVSLSDWLSGQKIRAKSNDRGISTINRRHLLILALILILIAPYGFFCL